MNPCGLVGNNASYQSAKAPRKILGALSVLCEKKISRVKIAEDAEKKYRRTGIQVEETNTDRYTQLLSYFCSKTN